MKKYLKLFTGMFLCALGCVMIIKADFGSAPWDVLHQGISKTIGVTIGQASITLGIFIVLLDIFLGQPIGIGTIATALGLGTSLAFILKFYDVDLKELKHKTIKEEIVSFKKKIK